MLSSVISLVLAGLILGFHNPLLHGLFGKVDDDVMASCREYLWITTLSLPFLAVYDAGAAPAALLCHLPAGKGSGVWLVLINNIFNALAYPFAGPLGKGLRAAGDVKFTMIVSISLTIAARLLFSALFGLWLGWGVIGVAIGMSIDLVFRGAIFLWRLKSRRWTQFHLI